MSVVNQKSLAEILGVTRRTVCNMQKEGMPVISKGHSNEYDTKSVIAWMVEREVSNRLKHEDGELLDPIRERARLLHHKANKLEIEVDLMKGNIVYADDVSHQWSRILGNARERILAMPHKLAHLMMHIGSVADAYQIINSEAYQCLNDLSDSMVE